MILNLASPEKSQVKYTRTDFPDNHHRVELLPLTDSLGVEIQTRLSSMDDVFVLLQATRALREAGCHATIDLTISYLLCGRYDRPMHKGDTCDLEIIADLVLLGGYRNITLIEPHSPASATLLRARTTIHPLDKYLQKYMTKFVVGQNVNKRYADVCVVAPDLGAAKRVDAFVTTLPYEVPVVYCNKTRDAVTGKVKEIEVLNKVNLRKNIIIYDDICAGGATFIELAKVIRSMGGDSNKDKITLAVTHGLFNEGMENIVRGGISEVITTNSYKDHNQISMSIKGLTLHIIPVI